MKREQNVNCLAGILLAFLLSLCGVGCMASGIRLEVESLPAVFGACFLCALVSGLCYRIPYGSWILRGLAVLGLLFLIRTPEWTVQWAQQLQAMLHRITKLWNHAYGFPLVSAGEVTVCDLPLMVVGGLVALVVSRAICCGKNGIFALILSFLPLASCLVVTDTVPDQPYLFGMLLGLAVLLFQATMPREELRQRLELMGMVLTVGAFALALLLRVSPEKIYVNRTGEILSHFAEMAQDLPASLKEWGQRFDFGGGSGIQPQRENLATLGDRIERQYTVLEVTGTAEELLYLRGQDYDSYNGKVWTATRNRSEGFNLPNRVPRVWGETRREVKISTRVNQEVRYVPYYPQAATTMVGGRIENDEELMSYSYVRLELLENWRETLLFSSTFVTEWDDSIFTTAGVYDRAQDIWRYRTLPLETQEQAKALLNTILTGTEINTTQKAEAIRLFVQNSAEYSLTPERMPGDAADFALWFLEEADSGYCVHFATAATVLLRAAGIDARYVTGYVCRTLPGRPVEVPQAQAHAWAEYFEPELGAWVVLEATPADIAGTPVTSETEAGSDIEVDLTLPTRPEETQPSIPEREETEGEEQNPLENPDRFEDVLEENGLLSGVFTALKRVFTAAFWLALVLGQSRLRLWLRRRRCMEGPPNARALALWREIERLHRLWGDSPGENLEQLAQKAKFSQHTLTASELLTLEAELRQVTELLRCLPWYRCLLHRIIFAAY